MKKKYLNFVMAIGLVLAGFTIGKIVNLPKPASAPIAEMATPAIVAERLKIAEILACDSYDAFEVNKAMESEPFFVGPESESGSIFWIDTDTDDDVTNMVLCHMSFGLQDGYKLVHINNYIAELDSDYNIGRHYLVTEDDVVAFKPEVIAEPEVSEM